MKKPMFYQKKVTSIPVQNKQISKQDKDENNQGSQSNLKSKQQQKIVNNYKSLDNEDKSYLIAKRISHQSKFY